MRILAVRLQFLQQFLELVLRQQRLRQQRHGLVRIEAAIAGRDRLAFRGDGIAQFERDPAEPVMRLGVLRIVADGVAQVDLRGFQIAFLQRRLGSSTR